MPEITEALSDGTALFGAVVVLAVTVAGFFLGRSWLERVESDSAYAARRQREDETGL